MTLTNSIPDLVGPAGKQTEKLIFNGLFAVLVAAALALYGTNIADSNDSRWLWIMALAGMSLLQMSSRAVVLEKIVFDRVEFALAGFVAYAALSLAWSPDPLAGYALLSKLGLLAAVFLCLKNAGNDVWFNWLCGAIAASAAVVLGFIFYGIGNMGGFGNQNFITEFLILAVPFIAALAFIYPHKVVRAAVLALILIDLGYLFFFNPSKIEFLVIAGLAIAAVTGWGWQRSRWLAAAGAFAVVVVVAAGVTYYWGVSHGFRFSIYPRLALAINTLLMWWDKFLIGHGAGSFNFMYSLYQERHLAWLDVGSEMFAAKQSIAGAAHNEFAQILATFGVIGAGLAGVFAWYLLRGLKGRPMTSYAWCGLVATGVWMLNALVEFPLQNPATALLAAIGLGFLARHGQSGSAAAAGAATPGIQGDALFVINLNQATKMLLLLGAVAVVGVAGYGGYRFSSANRHYFNTIKYLNVRPDYAFAENYEAYQLYPWDTYIRSQLYTTTTRWYELTGKPPLPPEELDRLFEISVGAVPSTQVLLARLQYLLNSRIYLKDVNYGQEMERWFGIVRKNASHTADARLLDAYYRAILGDFAGAGAELAAAEKLGLNPVQKGVHDKVRDAIRQAEAAKQEAAAKQKSTKP